MRGYPLFVRALKKRAPEPNPILTSFEERMLPAVAGVFAPLIEDLGGRSLRAVKALRSGDKSMASNFASSFSVQVVRFASKGAKLQTKSAYVGHADVVIRRTDDSADFADLMKGAFMKVDEDTIALQNIALKILPNAGPYVQVPEVKRGEKTLPLFRPSSADARAFLTEEIFADENVGEIAAQLSSELDEKLSSEETAPRQERKSAPAPEQSDLAQQVSKLTSLVEMLAEKVLSQSDDTCSEDELPY